MLWETSEVLKQRMNRSDQIYFYMVAFFFLSAINRIFQIIHTQKQANFECV